MEFQRYIKKYNLKAEKLINFNGPDPEVQYLSHITFQNFMHNKETGENDLHKLNYEDCCDFIILSQTLEHVYNPFKCVENIYKMLKKDGYFFTSVPVINRLHEYPYNFVTGFTPIGLASLLDQIGFKVLEVGQWGNRKYCSKLFKSRLWSTEKELKMGITHLGDLKSPFDIFKDGRINEFDYPTQCWALCKKT